MPASLQYTAPRESLALIKNLFEGYDNLLVMTMVDPKKGIFKLIFSDSMSDEVKKIVEGIRKEVHFEKI